MFRGNALIAAAIAGVTVVAAPPPADAQCRLCDAPQTSRVADEDKGEIRIEVETNLNFDRLILSGAGDGAAQLRPDGSASATGSVTDVSPRAMVGTVTLHGEPGRGIRIDLPRRIVLHSLNGGEVSFDEVVSDLPSLPRLDSMGNLTFRIGGRLTVSGDSDGEYRGDLPITADYL
jgi:hypothetical protein